MRRASTTCSQTDGTSRSHTTTVVEKSLRTSPLQTSWDTIHGDRTIRSPETVLLPMLVVKVVSHRGIATSTDTASDRVTLVPLMDTCTTCGASGHKAHSSLFPTQVTTTTQISLDSAGAKLIPTQAHHTDPIHTTTGVTTTTPTTVVKVSTSHLKDTSDTVVTTTSVWITLTAIG